MLALAVPAMPCVVSRATARLLDMTRTEWPVPYGGATWAENACWRWPVRSGRLELSAMWQPVLGLLPAAKIDRWIRAVHLFQACNV